MRVHSVGMPPPTYGAVLAANVRAARHRKRLDQANVVARMRALGFDQWHRQTMGKVERGERRLLAEEVFGLALALETSFMSLLEPVREDGPIALPSGAELLFLAVHELIWGGSDYTVRWHDDVPAFPAEERQPGYASEHEYSLPPPRRHRAVPNSEAGEH